MRALGRTAIAANGVNNADLEDETAALTRDAARDFARNEVAPIAQQIHREDLLVPDDLITKFAAQGFFGSSIPEEYGGTGMGYLPMVVMTEELSAASLGAAGSLHTRPEILAHALQTGGTEAQKQEWLPKLASGEALVAIGVTEPDVGSDNANLQCRATPAEVDGRRGWRLNGAKAWSTFSGRADVIAMLVRTNPNVEAAGRGLSVFIVPKDPHYGYEWRQTQPEGGSMTGTANPTPGYRGMHSYTIAIDNYFVPHENLVGEDEGLNRGFALQMGGFAVGRLQTGARACGVAQASLEKACQYVNQREQFGMPIGKYQLTEHRIGEMVARIAAARQLTYAAARNFNSRGIEAPMAKLLACDVAVGRPRTSQAAQQLHGGWGYSEEDPIARYVIDALVLPIFEGVKPILELKVIGRQLLRRELAPRGRDGCASRSPRTTRGSATSSGSPRSLRASATRSWTSAPTPRSRATTRCSSARRPRPSPPGTANAALSWAGRATARRWSPTACAACAVRSAGASSRPSWGDATTTPT